MSEKSLAEEVRTIAHTFGHLPNDDRRARVLSLADRIATLERSLDVAKVNAEQMEVYNKQCQDTLAAALSERDAARAEADRMRALCEAAKNLGAVHNPTQTPPAYGAIYNKALADYTALAPAAPPKEKWTPPLACAKCSTPLRKFAGGNEVPCRDCDGVLCEKCCDAAKAAPPKPEPAKEWREVVHAVAIPASSSGAERVVTALQLAEAVLEKVNASMHKDTAFPTAGEVEAALAALRALRGETP